MSRHGSVRKYAEWQGRLERFEASGMTVAEFCREEGLPPHRFYYWRRRVREAFRGPSTATRSRHERVDGVAIAGNGRSKPRTGSTEALPGDAPVVRTPPALQEPLVHFTLNSTLHVSIPATCLEAIRCVLQFAARNELDDAASDTAVRRFRQVVVTE
jgi:hypothetical protein